MITRISNKEVRGDTFSVAVPNVHQVVYEEGDRLAKIEIEGGMSKPGVVDWLVYKDTLLSWEAPYDNEELSACKRDEILKKVSESLKLLEMPHQFE